MTRNNFWLLLLVAIIATQACKKKKTTDTVTPLPPVDSTTNTTTYDDYTVLKPGNYWIYEHYILDSANGAAHPQGTYDSTYVEKDTVINSKTYHKYLYTGFNAGGYNTQYLRDSLSYTVDMNGHIIFSSEDFTNVFRSYTYGPNAATPDTLHVTERMDLKNETTVVAAGTFITSAFRVIYRFPAGYYLGPTRSYDHRYAKNTGLIRETTGFYTSLPQIYEKRLVRYYVRK